MKPILKYKNKMSRVLFIALITMTFFSCKSNHKKYTIGVSQCSVDIWREKLIDELTLSSYAYGNIELKVVSSKDDDRLQMQQINQLMSEGIDLLIVSPNQINTISSVVDSVYDSGIPVILFDRKTNSDKYTAFMGADNYGIGKVMGEYAASSMKGQGRIVEIMGLSGSSPAIERQRGFDDIVKKFPNIEIVAARNGDWTEKSGEEVMEEILKEGVSFNCVFAHNDRMANGARTSIKKKGLRDSIMYIGIDALSNDGGGMQKVMNGELTATYIYPTRGDLLMQLAVNILNGKPFQRDNYLKTSIVTDENVEALLMQADEMKYQRSRILDLQGKINQYLAQYSHQQVYAFLAGIIILLSLIYLITAYRNAVKKRMLMEESFNSKLNFFTNISHELRTPLTLIGDPVEDMIDDENLTVKQRNVLQIVRRNVNILMRLVNEILDFRKIQSGKMTMTLSDFDLDTYMRQWITVFEASAEKKKVKLNLDVDDKLSVRADVYKVERICYNLLSNAIKYTKEGGTVNFSAHKEGENYRIQVADTGVGIPKGELPQIFDKFFQAEKHTHGGTGLGLAIVKAFVELHKGKVEVESEEGKGTTFTVTMPLIAIGDNVVVAPDARTETEETAETSSASELSTKVIVDNMTAADNSEKMSILIVDDNIDIRAYIMAIAGEYYNVSQAENGEKGLSMAFKEVPDLIICDIMMPGIDGLEFCKKIKEDMITCHIPVILLTARTLDEQRAEGYESGADAYITKPFNSKVLLVRIKNLIDNRKRLKYVYSNTEKPVEEPSDNDAAFLANFKKIINKHLADSEFNVETASAEMGLSRVQLYRKVKALTGSTPVEIIKITRLKQAEVMLRTSEKTVAEVAYLVGFSSPSYFSKCYKEYFGKLPGAAHK